MMRPDDVAAGEYVLGTLDHQERLAFERALSREHREGAAHRDV